ncbi:MAG: bifunctional 2-polyprenyl-6-hydroxyphenol methylase/3-demethylubiquinol 3-O-methyltransferase UbiG [Pseudomonadota bacterium]
MSALSSRHTKPEPTANLDQHELDKFSDIAHLWWDRDSEFKPLHDINPLRLGYIQLNRPLPGLKVLDVGCGGGILTEALCAAGAGVTGIDLSASSIDVAKLHAAEHALDIDYLCTSTEEFSQTHAGQFDVVTCMELLEHVPDPGAIVEACSALLNDSGTAFFSTLNRNNKSYAFAIVGAEYVLKLLPKGTHDWKKFIKPSELSGWCRNSGLKVADLTGMTYNPLSRTYATSRDISVNYLATAEKHA